MARKDEKPGGAGYCGQSRAMAYDRWSLLPPEKRQNVGLFEMQGDPNSWAAPGSGAGRLFLCPRFEYAQVKPGQEPDYNGVRQRCLEPYEKLPATLIHLGREQDEAREELCRSGCPCYEETAGRKPACCYDFADRFRAVFEWQGGGRRKKAAWEAVYIHDLRLWGRPLTVELWHPRGRRPQALRDMAGSYPGLDHTALCSFALGNAVDRALLHDLPVPYISEVSGIEADAIASWKKTRILEASLALPQLVTRYTLEDCGRFSAWTENHSLLVPDKLHGSRWEKYTFTYRREGEQPPRLISIYPATEWNLVRKLASTALTQLMGSHKVGLSPGRLFNLAVDFLSAALCNSYGAGRELSPALGGMLFLALCEEERPGCGEELFQKLDQPYRDYYTGCYRKLLQLYQDLGRESWPSLPEMLHALFQEEEGAGELAQGTAAWYDDCVSRAGRDGVNLVVCEAMREPFWSPLKLQLLAELTESGAVPTVRELITRLLLLNPATMATVQTDHNGSSQGRTQRMELGEGGNYHCPFRTGGGLEYTNVVPGILTDELHDLLEQDFLRGEQECYLVKRQTE